MLPEKGRPHDRMNERIKGRLAGPVARRHRADTVSPGHVDQATAHLISIRSSRVYRHLGTIGGIFLGASLSNILSMSLAAQYTREGTLASVAFGIVGAFLVALHMAKE